MHVHCTPQDRQRQKKPAEREASGLPWRDRGLRLRTRDDLAVEGIGWSAEDTARAKQVGMSLIRRGRINQDRLMSVWEPALRPGSAAVAQCGNPIEGGVRDERRHSRR